MVIDSIIIAKSDTGIALYSRNFEDVEKDLFAGYLTALKSFLSDFSLGGLSSFKTEEKIIIVASVHNILASVILNKKYSSEKYYSLSYIIAEKFHQAFKDELSINTIKALDTSRFNPIIDQILSNFNRSTETQKHVFSLYSVTNSGDLKEIEFSTKEELLALPILVIVNYAIKQIQVLEISPDVSNRILFMANREASRLNSTKFRHSYNIRKITEPLEHERLINQLNNIVENSLLN